MPLPAAVRTARPRVRPSVVAWTLTALATVASTYALDGFAIAAGTLLAASGALAGLHAGVLLAVLAATYAVWAAGMRVNLAANWQLLCATGTSSNVLSKAAHDVARARGAAPHRRRLAASSGYVLTELLKELPYYAGAAGAAVFSDAVSDRDAIIFLAGTNLGAAAYELGLARATRLLLGRRRPADDADQARAAPAGPSGATAARLP